MLTELGMNENNDAQSSEDVMRMAVIAAGLFTAAALTGAAQAADIKVLGTPAVREFYVELVASSRRRADTRSRPNGPAPSTS